MSTPMTKIREEWRKGKMTVEFLHGVPVEIPNVFLDKIADWFINRFQQELEKATRCQKPVENGEAICGCKLDCHLHDWRQKEMLTAELSSLEGEIKAIFSDGSKVEYADYDKALIDVLKIIRQHKERYED